MEPKHRPEHEAEMLVVLGRVLGLKGRGRLEAQPLIDGAGRAFRPDYRYVEGRRTVLVDVKDRASVADVAMASAARDILRRKGRGGRGVEYVILSRQIPGEVKEMARALEVPVLRLEWGSALPRGRGGAQTVVMRLSSEKAWRVAASLIGSGPISVRGLAKAAGVSYGWAHKVVGRLIDLHIASRTPQGIVIEDVDALLKGVAWERDIQKLRVAELPVAGDDVIEAARLVRGELDRSGIRAAFTAITAGGIYTGHSMRFDALYAYIDLEGRYGPSERPARGQGLYTSGDNLVKWNMGTVRRMLEDGGGKVRLSVHLPDRDVFARAEERSGLSLVSPAQALLDLAGLGYGAWELAKEMVTCVEQANG